MTRYLPARHYRWFGIAAIVLSLVLGAFARWLGWSWVLTSIPSGLLLVTAALSLWLAFLPAIEVQESHLTIGQRRIPWMDIRRLDRTGWISPLILRLTLYDDSRFLLMYPGDLDSCNTLLRHLRRFSTDALIDGIPYRQYWGEVLSPGPERKPIAPPPRYRVLRPEDEAEVERLYQRLKTVGNLDQKSSDEK
jgi:energy-coupling factor transporter transmembrane protein EcfT